MPRVVPSQIVDLIDKLFPWAKDQKECDDKYFVTAGSANSIAAILELAQQIPAELIALDAESYAEFVSSVAALRTQIQQWNSMGDTSFHRIPGLRQLSPVTLIRQALAKCPDAIPNVGTTDLDFITDPSLRESIRLDISTANSALANGEWKAATVLAGSVIEALLLWTLQQKPPADVRTSIGTISRQFAADMQKWNLADYIDVSTALGFLKDNTVAQCRLAKDFRNLIHPGRAQRTGQPCNRGTALSAVAAIEHVVNDLSL